MAWGAGPLVHVPGPARRSRALWIGKRSGVFSWEARVQAMDAMIKYRVDIVFQLVESPIMY